MSELHLTFLIIVGIPFLAVIICWLALMITMKATTGELKCWLTPDNLIKVVAIIFVIEAVLVLGVLKILEGGTSAAILSGIIGYTLGTSFYKN